MKYKMYIDDIRTPKNSGDWCIVRNVIDAIDVILLSGVPQYISFDHDLGPEEATGYDLARWLVEYDINMNYTAIPVDFGFNVHSANPVGAENIQKLLDNYLEFRRD